MKIEEIRYTTSQIKEGLTKIAEVQEKYGDKMTHLNQNDYTKEEIEEIERQNDEIEELLIKARMEYR